MVSVIIPTYHPAEYIYRCLHSLKDQSLSHDDYEVVVVLNGCKEPYLGQLNTFIKKQLINLDISLYQLDEGSVSNARNYGIEHSKGDYIAFIDDDDWVSSTYLERLLEKATPHTLVISNSSAIDEETQKVVPYSMEKAYSTLSGKGEVSVLRAKRLLSGPCMKILHREMIAEHRFDKRFRLGEDSLFMFAISDEISSVKFSRDDAVYFRSIRQTSAMYGKRSFWENAKNRIRLCAAYTSTYLKKPGQYHMTFYLTRILASLKSILVGK